MVYKHKKVVSVATHERSTNKNDTEMSLFLLSRLEIIYNLIITRISKCVGE